jgi:hypothetical protein
MVRGRERPWPRQAACEHPGRCRSVRGDVAALDRVGVEDALSMVAVQRQQEVVRFLRWARVNWWRWLTSAKWRVRVRDT